MLCTVVLYFTALLIRYHGGTVTFLQYSSCLFSTSFVCLELQLGEGLKTLEYSVYGGRNTKNEASGAFYLHFVCRQLSSQIILVTTSVAVQYQRAPQNPRQAAPRRAKRPFWLVRNPSITPIFEGSKTRTRHSVFRVPENVQFEPYFTCAVSMLGWLHVQQYFN